MIYTLEQIDQLTKESVRRENALIAEYRRTHTVPGRGVISTPEIDAERAEQKRLYVLVAYTHQMLVKQHFQCW